MTTIADIDLPLPADQVWPHLREPERLRRWHGWHYEDFEAELESVYAMHATVEVPGRVLVLGGHRVTLDDVEGGARLRLSRAAAPDKSTVVIEQGWITFFEQLRYVLTVHPGGARHTFMMEGTQPGAGFPWPHEEWARSERQVAVVVPGWGQVLVTLVRPDAHGGGQLVVTGYGRTDEQAQAQHADLVRWWSGATS